jgi:hypothetical protein
MNDCADMLALTADLHLDDKSLGIRVADCN